MKEGRQQWNHLGNVKRRVTGTGSGSEQKVSGI